MTVLELVEFTSRYIAAAHLSFIPSSNEQIGSGMIFDAEKFSLVSDKLNDEGVRLAINLEFGSLDVLHPEFDELASYPLLNARHLDIINWIERERQLLGFEEKYDYALIKQIGFSLPDDEFTLPKIGMESFKELGRIIQELTVFLISFTNVFDKVTGPELNLETCTFCFEGSFENQKIEKLTISLTQNHQLGFELKSLVDQKEVPGRIQIGNTEAIKTVLKDILH